ncbi:avidin/streptavidin family protein [Pseudomonas sp. S191]|uniref:avidin/streptavidin family protein n=1 Tax=unclassified Pseudomonas TaxID=196821 RepID=UPI001F5A2D4B|nr:MULTISPECIES: avidin/streptavidin family protein [unclassified Pseudomonas]UNM17237.1 peptidase A1 pepsin [Pseudomonas sp. ArH3a]UXZ20107.1 peptidase A1 pepsin [Pseudomonas sp. YeP6b]
MANRPSPSSLVFPMQRGPFQNNGATPWYCPLKLGTPAQTLKFAIDTGTNINWVTSTLCPDDQCVHFAGGRFDVHASSTASFNDCLRRPYSFGPWGTMQVESASDLLTTPAGAQLDTQLFLAAAYEGEQFKQLDWDGGLGLPCSSAYVEGRHSFVLQTLMREGQLDPAYPFVTFDWNADAHNGTCRMGAVDPLKTKGACVFLPWSVYTALPGVEYIWSAELTSYSVGSEQLASNLKFAIDSGSSRFKGDDRLMRQTLARMALGDQPNVVLGFADGEITLGADLYNCLIEEGPQKNQVLPQFAPLGLTDLVLVGSVVMEHCYTVYEYQVVKCSNTVYSLAPVGVWLFNRPDGPKIITQSSSTPFIPGKRTVLDGSAAPPRSAEETVSVAGTWQNDYGSLMTLEVSGQHVFGTYQSSTGSTGHYAISGSLLGPGATRLKNQPLALAIEWHDLGNETSDPSWQWASGLSGQLSTGDKGDVLALSHLLVASSEFPDLANRGNYIDKLVYRRVAQPSLATPCAPIESISIDNDLSGRWVASDETLLSLTVEADSQHRFGIVQGRLTSGGVFVEVSGFTDINAVSSKLAFQSVSLTVTNTQAGEVSTLCGTLDLAGQTLSLVVLASSPVAPAQAYLATKLSSLRFIRATSPVSFPSTAYTRNTRYSTY